MYVYFFIIVILSFIIAMLYGRIKKYRNIYWRMSKLVDNSPFMIWVKDPSGKTFFQNKLCKEKKIIEEDIENSTSRIGMKIGDVISGKENYFEFEKKIKEKNENKIYENIVYCVKNRNGTVVASAGVAYDITAKERYKKELLLKTTVFDNISEGIIITNNNGEVIEVNSSFLETTGYKAEELLNKIISLLKSENDSEQFFQELWKELLKNGRWEGEVFNKKKDGTIYPVNLSIKSVLNQIDSSINYVFIFEDLTYLKDSRESIDKLSNYDRLTGIPNSFLFRDRLEQTVIGSKSHLEMFAVIRIDINNFKIINDSFGFKAGDLIIKEVSKRIKQELKETDTVARVSGDEFIVILTELKNIEEAALFSQRVITGFRSPFKLEDNEIFLGISMGIAFFPDDGFSPEELMTYSNIALGHAKSQGKNNYQFYTNELNKSSFERVELEGAMRHALEKEEYVLYYQPQIEFETNKIIGAEALIRWKKSDGTMVAPDKFIPVAEENGIIIPLGEWVLYNACVQNKYWQEQGVGNITVSVNMSPQQMRQPNIVEVVTRILKTTELAPEYLELEITEGVLMEDKADILKKIKSFRDMGIKIAIDDFGTGYSSLGYLKQFPMDKLKIDQRFIRDIPINDDGALSKIMILLGKSLKMKVIAEGVETKHQVEFLKENRCDEGQGYFYSRPIPAEEFEALLRRNMN